MLLSGHRHVQLTPPTPAPPRPRVAPPPMAAPASTPRPPASQCIC